MNLLKDYSFRDLINKYIYIGNKEILPIIANYFDVSEETTGILVYCYLQHSQGMSLEVLCTAYFDESSKALKLHTPNETRVALPYGAMLDSSALVLPDSILPIDRFSDKVEAILSQTRVNETITKTRNITAIDHLRNNENPDAVQVQLVHGDEHIESHYVLLEDVGDMNLTGTLISEPEYNYGVHQGESINFFLVRNEKGVMCLAML